MANSPSPRESIVRPLRKRLRMWADLAKVITYDAQRFVRHSGLLRKSKHPPSMAALITKQYHRIEKGLALPQPRAGFGESGIHELCMLIQEGLRKQTCRPEITLAVDALVGYRDFNLSHGIAPFPWLDATIKLAVDSGIAVTGTPVRPAATHPSLPTGNPGLDMIVGRTSVRDFSDAHVPDAVLEQAVLAAQHAPCVCNRQSGRIHLLRDEAARKTALAHQNGNRGFGHTASVIAVVTVDQAEMLEPTERYQHWIDGGMFAQNFLLGLHAQGYGACPLNWSSSVAKDRQIRKALSFLPASETIIMLIAIGSLKSDYHVARSARRQLSEVMKIV